MNKIEQFFDQMASSWDQGEHHSEKEKTDLLDELGLHKGDKVIDLGCGTGVISGLIHHYTESEVLGVDLSINMIEIAKKKYGKEPDIHFIHGDFLSMDFSETYDYVIIYNAYPHFLEVEVLSSALAKALKKGGKFAVLHSLSKEELSTHHHAKAEQVSRDIASPEAEGKYFAKYFDIIKAKETDHSYLLVGQKKSSL